MVYGSTREQGHPVADYILPQRMDVIRLARVYRADNSACCHPGGSSRLGFPDHKTTPVYGRGIIAARLNEIPFWIEL
jgi:hypothetical protein